MDVVRGTPARSFRARLECAAPASAIHVAPIANLENENDQSPVLNVADHPVVTHPVSPTSTELARECVSQSARIIRPSDPLVHEVEDAPRSLALRLS